MKIGRKVENREMILECERRSEVSLMDLSLGPAISIYMTLALPICKQHS